MTLFKPTTERGAVHSRGCHGRSAIASATNNFLLPRIDHSGELRYQQRRCLPRPLQGHGVIVRGRFKDVFAGAETCNIQIYHCFKRPTGRVIAYPCLFSGSADASGVSYRLSWGMAPREVSYTTWKGDNSGG